MKVEDPQKIAERKEKELKATLNAVEENFFKRIANDEEDLNMIKARGEAAMKEMPESNS